ncbi:MAG TPA: 2-C-methyl-D-erythritol 2,4-cyclodiphosphate synthase [Acidimicrobiia bacterium]|nr:2-C-methyl-D-erythritol 2,4-cyclodiphosphate synthase [Acidimicrobiia bacterium]
MTPGEPAAGSRVGWGFDAHRLDGAPPLKLGGIVVSESVGVSATSDGDVLAHAVTDALMGACVLGDIGEHFPSDAPESRGVDSMVLLEQAATMAAAAGWGPTHLDVTVVAESIRIGPHRSAIARSLAEVLGLGTEAVSVKATTTDGLGFTGSGEGLAAVAVLSVAPLS